MSKTKIIIGMFEKMDKGKIDFMGVVFFLGMTSRWVRELYRRYKAGEALFKKRGHRNSTLNKRQKNIIRVMYREISYERKNRMYTPSMFILKYFVETEFVKFPRVSIETYRNVVKDSDIYPRYKSSKRKVYRKKWEAPYVGMIMQGDTSIHMWIPGLNQKLHLILFIDDRSRKVLYARFLEQDLLKHHITALKSIFYTYGKPLALYYDNAPSYYKKNEDALIVRALEEIDVRLINSRPGVPQGKGKVERQFKTFQEQLPHFIKKENPATIDELNDVLANYVKMHDNTRNRAIGATPNERFKNSEDVFQDIHQNEIEDIENAFTEKTTRKVDNVNEISFHGAKYIVPPYKNLSLAGSTVEIRENPYEWFKIFYKGHCLKKYSWEAHNDKTDY